MYLCLTELFEIELFDDLSMHKQMTDAELNSLCETAIPETIKLCANIKITVRIKVKPFNHVKKFKNAIYKICLQIMYLIYINKKNLVLNNLQ